MRTCAKSHSLRRRYGSAQRYLQAHHRFAIYGLVPKTTGRGMWRGTRDGEYMKKRMLVGRARDAYEAAAELYRLREEQRASGATGSGRWEYIVIDRHAGKGKLAPVVSYEELVEMARRAAR